MASTDYKKNDYILESVTNQIHFVVKKDVNNIIVRREKDDELIEYPIHHVNRYFEPIDYETAKILYQEENKEVPMEVRNQSNPVSMGIKRLKNAARALKGDLK